VPTLGALLLVAACVGPRGSQLDVWEQKAIAEEAYVYAFPMIAAYKAMHEFNVDRASSQYKGPFNQIVSDARVFTPKDTAIVTPNSDTPYSMLQMDLRAEPIVLWVPEVEKRRYYSVQLTDMYSFNYGYIGSRATGNGAGCYMVSGPDWKGEKPAGVAKVFASETQFSLAIYRTQLFDPADIDNVKKIQAGYEARPLSAFLGQPAPSAPPDPDFPKFSENAFKTDFIAYLNFLLQFCPTVPEEAALRERFAAIGIGSGKGYDFKSLPLEDRLAVGLAVKDGYESIEKGRDTIGTEANGWRVGSAFGDRGSRHNERGCRSPAGHSTTHSAVARGPGAPRRRGDRRAVDRHRDTERRLRPRARLRAHALGFACVALATASSQSALGVRPSDSARSSMFSRT